MRPASADAEVELRPLAARSVVLSVLLGAHPPELPVRELVRFAEDFRISDATLRVALSRMVGAGDLLRDGSSYRLSERLLERQRRQDYAVHPITTAWDGTWEMVTITATGRNASDRAALRSQLSSLRFAELREGTWLRPANLSRPWPSRLDSLVERFAATPHRDPRELAHKLWDLDAWAARAGTLLRTFEAASTQAERLTLAAAMVRALVTDPVLPEELLTQHPWPAAALRAAYVDYRAELIRTSSVPHHDLTA